MRTLYSILSDLVFLFYPEYCVSCSDEVPVNEHIFCMNCLFHIPYTDHFKNPENDFMFHFLGRQKLEFAIALFQMQKGGRVHSMISKLKYKRRKDIGLAIGKMFGEQLVDSDKYSDIDYIIPVPLHKRKLRKRGYNQSEVFADGISSVTTCSVNTHCLIKISRTDSQTSKNRNQRLENVFDSYLLRDKELLENKHVLLVDDIVTTGATLEACILKLKEIPGIRISLGAIAITE